MCYRCRTNLAWVVLSVPRRTDWLVEELCIGCRDWVREWIQARQEIGAPLLPGPYMVFDRQGV